MPRYERAETLLALVLALQAPGRGLSIADMQERFEISRRTAERLRDAVERLFPGLWWELGPDGCRYWKLRRGDANGLMSFGLAELAAAERALRIARDGDDPTHARALEGLVEKIRTLIRTPAAEAPALAPRHGGNGSDPHTRLAHPARPLDVGS